MDHQTLQRHIQVKEACQLIGVSKVTLLRYESLGIFPSPNRNQANGYRYYTEDEIQKLRSILFESRP